MITRTDPVCWSIVVEVRRVQEPAWVWDEIARKTGLDHDFIAAAVRDVRYVVDEFFADGCSIFASPFVLWRTGDPVFRALLDQVRDRPSLVLKDLVALETSALAALLGVEQDLVERFPVAWWHDIFIGLIDLRGIANRDPDVKRLETVLDAWLGTVGCDETGHARRNYHVSQVGLERDFQKWVMARPKLLHQFGYPIDLGLGTRRHRGGEEWRFANGRRADLIYRLNEDIPDVSAGDWLIVENKATMVGLEAFDQIQHYIRAAKTELVEGNQKVFGLLLADGVTVDLEYGLHDAGIGYVSLAELGYRKHLHLAETPIVPDPKAAAFRDEQTVTDLRLQRT